MARICTCVYVQPHYALAVHLQCTDTGIHTMYELYELPTYEPTYEPYVLTTYAPAYEPMYEPTCVLRAYYVRTTCAPRAYYVRTTCSPRPSTRSV